MLHLSEMENAILHVEEREPMAMAPSSCMSQSSLPCDSNTSHCTVLPNLTALGFTFKISLGEKLKP